MEIYVVRPGDTVYRIARRYGVPVSQILIDNQISQPEHLVVGQALVVQMPRQTHTVAPGDTLAAIARQHGITLRQLYRNNPILGGEELIYPGQTLVIAYEGTPKDTLSVNGYAYPYIDKDLLTATVPYLTVLTPFTYEFDERGELTDLQDQVLIAMAEQGGAAPIMHLSNLTDQGFSTQLASLALGMRRCSSAYSGRRQTSWPSGGTGAWMWISRTWPGRTPRPTPPFWNSAASCWRRGCLWWPPWRPRPLPASPACSLKATTTKPSARRWTRCC